MATIPATNDTVTVTPGSRIQDTRGSDIYTPVSEGTRFEITFNAGSANSGDVDTIESGTSGTINLYGTLTAGLRGNDLVIRMLENDPWRGEVIDHYVYIKDYALDPGRFDIYSWNGTTATEFVPSTPYDLNVIGDNSGNLLYVYTSYPDFGSPTFYTVHGLNGNDAIMAAEGQHRLYGGAGDDLYIVNQHSGILSTYAAIIIDTSGSNDRLRITNFDPAETDPADAPLVQLGTIYQTAKGLEYLESYSDPTVKWGWDSHGAETVGMISGIRSTTTAALLNGTDGQDILFGGRAYDGLTRIVDGGAGDDWIYGPGNLRGGTGDDYIRSSGSDNLVQGGDGNDQLFGSGDNTILAGEAGDDTLNGGYGNDILRGGAGIDRFFGGQGIDTVDYVDATQSVRVDLSEQRGVGGDALGERYSSIENVNGSVYDDILIGTSATNILSGDAGDDVLIGGGGRDQLNGGEGFDVVSYSTVSRSVVASLISNIGAQGGAWGDVYTSIEGLNGSAFNDTLYGSSGDNALKGLGGNDLLAGGAGADLLDGGAGIDTVSYSTSGAGVFILLHAGRGEGGDAEGDIYVDIESASGSAFNDIIYIGETTTTVRGLNGDDLIVASGGSSRLEGGNGFDTVTYSNAADGVELSLRTGKGTAGAAAGDVYVGIEAVNGSGFADTIRGNTADNTLNGLGGDDVLDGDGGDDTLIGGSGNDQLAGGAGGDRLTGGSGADRFIYQAVTDSAVGPVGRDIIADFSRGENDRIDLSGIDADIAQAGDQAFSFLGTDAFTGETGQIRYFSTPLYQVVEVDLDGDAVADMQIRVNGAANLIASDFIL